jgi:hypothetical protein
MGRGGQLPASTGIVQGLPPLSSNIFWLKKVNARLHTARVPQPRKSLLLLLRRRRRFSNVTKHAVRRVKLCISCSIASRALLLRLPPPLPALLEPLRPPPSLPAASPSPLPPSPQVPFALHSQPFRPLPSATDPPPSLRRRSFRCVFCCCGRTVCLQGLGTRSPRPLLQWHDRSRRHGRRRPSPR